MVVDAGNDLIAGGEGRAADLDLALAEYPRLLADISRHRVQLLDLGVSLGDHYGVLGALVGPMPIGDHRLAPRIGVGGDRDPLSGLIEAQRLAALACAYPLRRDAVKLVLVADHLVQVDRLGAFRQRPEQTARLDL